MLKKIMKLYLHRSQKLVTFSKKVFRCGYFNQIFVITFLFISVMKVYLTQTLMGMSPFASP